MKRCQYPEDESVSLRILPQAASILPHWYAAAAGLSRRTRLTAPCI